MCNPEITDTALWINNSLSFSFLTKPPPTTATTFLLSDLLADSSIVLTIHWWSDLPHCSAQSDLHKCLVKSEKRRSRVSSMNVSHRDISSPFKANTSRLITQDFPNTAQLSEILNHSLITTFGRRFAVMYQKITTFLMKSLSFHASCAMPVK